MPSSSPSSDLTRVPKYRLHKPSGRAVVTIGGRDHYLGKWNTKESLARYRCLIGEYLVNSGCPSVAENRGFTIAMLCLAYRRFARKYYRHPDGRPTSSLERIRVAVRILRQEYGPTFAQDFRPLALQNIQQRLVETGKSRVYVNYLVDVIKRIFKWGVSQELLPVETYQTLTTVPNLKRGRTDAPEMEPVKPVDDAIVEATLPYLGETVAAMVRLQRLLGCRPGEICRLRPVDLDRNDDVWLYRVPLHKTSYRGKERIIPIGPQAQEILRPYLLREEVAYCFSPTESENQRRKARHATRRTPLHYGNRPGTNRKRRPKTKPRDRYDTNTFRQAIHRALNRANRERTKREEALLPKWSPNQLRHAAATEIRKAFGLEAAQVVLGHSQANITEIYAERNMTLAAEVARQIG